MQHKVTAQIGSTQITIETGKLAKQADGAVTVPAAKPSSSCAVSATAIKEGQDFFPLTVDYREKAAAAGKFPGGYFKREGRPTEKEILTCRLTDRPIRPLFPEGLSLRNAGQLDPAQRRRRKRSRHSRIIGASAALMVSDIPWDGPLGAVRVGRVNGQFVANPTHAEREQSDLDLVYVGNENDIVMIEGAAKELPEADFIAALEFAQDHAAEMIRFRRNSPRKSARRNAKSRCSTVQPEILEMPTSVAGDRIVAALYTRQSRARKAVGALAR